MIRTLRVLSVLPLLGLAACAADEPAVDIEAEKAALLELDAEWSRLASEGADVDAIVSYWSDDAIVVPPDQPAVRGREALREMVASSAHIPGWSISWESDEPHVSPDGRMAWMTGRNRMTMQGADGDLITMHGRGVTVWEKNAAGEWKCVFDVWNNAPPEQAAAPTAG
ncbi:MAG TPA: DUF4440 domain-containing protein [Longimicrobiales bacterium]|nr:DUF4440 domain-containing protein [Longimicrobiales bacterium]